MNAHRPVICNPDLTNLVELAENPAALFREDLPNLRSGPFQ